MTAPSWQQVAAALANPRLREVYAEAVLGLPTDAASKELKKLTNAGLLQVSSTGPAAGEPETTDVSPAGPNAPSPEAVPAVQVNENLFAELLASQQSNKPTGPDRFFHHGRITALPRKDDDRHELLAHLAVRLFPSEDVLDENQVNLVLRTVARDVPSLRRALVDYGYLRRDIDGSKYWRAA